MSIDENLIKLSAFDAAARIAKGELSSFDLVQACLDRIAERDPQVGAWEHIASREALQQARAADCPSARGCLHGVPVAIKDIIDTVDMPTRYGSPIYAKHQPGSDAACVALLRAAGAIVLGKTVTTEFAYFEPGRTRNPHNLDCTPGGSSMGSAAAVADGMAPIALGTQTAGSVIRPAAFCGVIGYKATYNALSLAGVKPFSPSLDTLGIFGRSIADIRLVSRALLGSHATEPAPERIRITVCKTAHWSSADAATKIAIARAGKQLQDAGASVVEREWPAPFDDLHDAQQTIMAYEAARSFAYERLTFAHQLSPKLQELCTTGLQCPFEQYAAAQRLAQQCRRLLPELFADVDAILCPSTPGEAPVGRATGNPVFNRPWTLLHVPAVTVPAFTGPRGLPIGIQLVADRYQDARLLGTAEWVYGNCGGSVTAAECIEERTTSS